MVIHCVLLLFGSFLETGLTGDRYMCDNLIVPGDGQYILPPRPFSRFVFYAGAMSLGTFEETRPEGGFLRFLRFSIVRSHREAGVSCNIPKRGCMRGRLCCAGVPPRFARPPAVLRCRSSAVPRACAQGTNLRLFLGLGSRSRTTVVLERELERASGRRFAPLSERSE